MLLKQRKETKKEQNWVTTYFLRIGTIFVSNVELITAEDKLSRLNQRQRGKQEEAVYNQEGKGQQLGCRKGDGRWGGTDSGNDRRREAKITDGEHSGSLYTLNCCSTTTFQRPADKTARGEEGSKKVQKL